MSYFESAANITITQDRALVELSKHGVDDPSDFYSDCGQRDEYGAQTVLEWLGY